MSARILSTIAAVVLFAACGQSDIVVDSFEEDAAAGATQQTTPTQQQPVFPQCKGAPYPFVLAHGFTGFKDIGPISYFFNVAEDLRANGYVVYEAEVDPYNSSEVRGAQLAQIIERVRKEQGACKVNVIAHSQGGIDVRYAIGTLELGDRISSVVTVSTPHRGTKLADVISGVVPGEVDPLLDVVSKLVGKVINSATEDADMRAAMTSLSEENMLGAFKAQNPDDPRVEFFSVAGRSGLLKADAECAGSLWPNSDDVDPVTPLLLPTEVFLAGDPSKPTPNDGLVTVASAKWGTFLGCVPADHLDEIGQIADSSATSNFDHLKFYRKVATFLRDRGN